MSMTCESCGEPSSSALCWACDDEEYMQMANASCDAKKKQREDDIAQLRTLVGDDDCVDKLLDNPNHISDKLLDVDEELISRITGKPMCPKKKIEALKKRLMKYANISKGNVLIVECIKRGHIKNHKRQHQEIMEYIRDNFDLSVLSSDILKPLFNKNSAEAKEIVLACAKRIYAIMKQSKYNRYITSGRTDAKGVKRTKEEVEENESTLRIGLVIELILNCKDINLKQGNVNVQSVSKRKIDDVLRRQGREYMSACMLVEIYKCMHDEFSIPPPLFGSLFKLLINKPNMVLFIDTAEALRKCDSDAAIFKYSHPKKVMSYISTMEQAIIKANKELGLIHPTYFLTINMPTKRKAK